MNFSYEDKIADFGIKAFRVVKNCCWSLDVGYSGVVDDCCRGAARSGNIQRYGLLNMMSLIRAGWCWSNTNEAIQTACMNEANITYLCCEHFIPLTGA